MSTDNQNDFFLELEKIANFSTDVVAPDDVANEPMVPDTAPHVDPETVEKVQTANAEVPPTHADEQLPSSPEDDKALADAIGEAQQMYESAQQHLASLEDEREQLEKVAEEIHELLPSMGALARLIHYSTDDSIPENLHKLASDRLVMALKDEEGYEEILQKTAGELFVDEENIHQLHSQSGRDYVLEHLASFVESEELEKMAFEVGGIVNAAQDIAKDYVEGASKLWKLDSEIESARAAVNEAKNVALQKTEALEQLKEVNHPELRQNTQDEFNAAILNRQNADNELWHKQDLQAKGRQVWGVGAAGLAGGAFLGGKAIANTIKSHNGPEEELSEKSASVTMNLENNDQIKGGNSQMSIVKDFLKIAGAAGLLEIANDESQSLEMRKEATAAFNDIARMSRSDMEQSFEKMATSIYTEPELHEIVSGKHNDYLFDKIAYFTDLVDLSVDDLEKVAGADGVAAKGVGGALTDAKSNIEEKVKADKEKTETIKNGEIGTRKPDDMRGYNVINNPGAYKVEKTAATQTMIEEAELRKEAAYKAFVEADSFIKSNQ